MKKINALELIALSVGAIIGWGAFILPGELFIKEIGVLNSIIGLGIGAITMIIIEKSYKYMISNFSVEGGEFGYAYIGFNKLISFITGWFLILAYVSIIPLNTTAVILIIEKFFGNILKFGFSYKIVESYIYFPELVVIFLIIGFFTYCNIKGILYSTKVQNIMVILLVIFVLGLGIIALLDVKIDKILLYNQLLINKKNINIFKIMKILAITPWAYIGFATVTQVTNDLKIPSKKISLLTEFSIILGCIIYIILILLTGINYDTKILNTENVVWATGSSIEEIFGKKGLALLGIALLMAVLAGVNGFFIATIKLIESMNSKNMLPLFLSKSKNNIIIFVSIIVLMISCIGRNILLWITDISSLGAAIGYLSTCLTVMRLSYQKKEKNFFNISLIGGIISLGFCVLLLFPNFASNLTIYSYVILIVWMIIGISFYIKINKRCKT